MRTNSLVKVAAWKRKGKRGKKVWTTAHPSICKSYACFQTKCLILKFKSQKSTSNSFYSLVSGTVSSAPIRTCYWHFKSSRKSIFFYKLGSNIWACKYSMKSVHKQIKNPQTQILYHIKHFSSFKHIHALAQVTLRGLTNWAQLSHTELHPDNTISSIWWHLSTNTFMLSHQSLLSMQNYTCHITKYKL